MTTVAPGGGTEPMGKALARPGEPHAGARGGLDGGGYAPGIDERDGKLACGGLNAGSGRWKERPRWF
jgi:hypothetical protein